MYTKQPKKMMIFDIYEILRKYSDANHRLSQKNIENYLETEYDMTVNRKSVKRNIMELIDMGLDIQWSERIRKVKFQDSDETEEQIIYTDFYLQRDITDCELQLLIDEVLDAGYISDNQRRNLIHKLNEMSSVYFKKNNTYSDRKLNNRTPSNQLFYSLEIINEAIESRKKVRFFYKYYHVTKRDLIESKCEYVVTPYETEICSGKYLLHCLNSDGRYVDFRIDYIFDVIIDNARGESLNRKQRNREYNDITIKYLSDEEMLPEFIDRFGVDSLEFDRSLNDSVLVFVRTNEKKAIDFAIENISNVILLAPTDIRDQTMKKLKKGVEVYVGKVDIEVC